MTPAERFAAQAYELVQRLGTPAQQLEAKARRAELNAWPKYRPDLVRAKQGRAS